MAPFRNGTIVVSGNETESHDFEFWPIEHPIEPLDEDRPVKCPVLNSSVLNVSVCIFYCSLLLTCLHFSVISLNISCNKLMPPNTSSNHSIQILPLTYLLVSNMHRMKACSFQIT